MEKITLNDDSFDKIERFKKDRKPFLLNTNNNNIKILLMGKEKTMIFSVVESKGIENIDFSEYVLRDFLGKEIQIINKKYTIISILSKEDFEDGIYKNSEHLAMETIDKFKGKGFNSEMFKVKELVDGIMGRSVEKLISNIYILLKQGYKVVGKIDKNTGREIPFNGQDFIERIINLKMKKGDFNGRLDISYIFEKGKT